MSVIEIHGSSDRRSLIKRFERKSKYDAIRELIDWLEVNWRRIDQLESENKALAAQLAQQAPQCSEAPATQVLVDLLGERLLASGAENYLEDSYDLEFETTGKKVQVVVRLQHPDRPTPHQLRIEAEAHAAQIAVPHGFVPMPEALTAENGAKGLLLGEFKIQHEVNCSGCYYDEADPECEVCGGEIQYTEWVPVPWDTIKAIYTRAVTGLGKVATATPANTQHGYLVWNPEAGEGVVFDDRDDAEYASTGDDKGRLSVSTLAWRWRDHSCDEDETVYPITEISVPTPGESNQGGPA